jgi:hypothetical protein
VHTPRGTITAAHVVHATNGWSAHLLARMRTKIIPVRGVMSAQRPGAGLSPPSGGAAPGNPFADPAPSQGASAEKEEEKGEEEAKSAYAIPVPGMRSYVFYGGTGGYDYLTQLASPGHELMFGGGFVRGGGEGLEEIGAADDGDYNVTIGAHLGGALPVYFGEDKWGAEGGEGEEEDEGGRWHAGRVKAFWSGVLGISADGQPWVGRLPAKVAGRKAPGAELVVPKMPGAKGEGVETGEGALTAAPGEWIAAGYSGEGMVHAWMCGKALGCMILGAKAEREMKVSRFGSSTVLAALVPSICASESARPSGNLCRVPFATARPRLRCRAPVLLRRATALSGGPVTPWPVAMFPLRFLRRSMGLMPAFAPADCQTCACTIASLLSSGEWRY